jgi:hypothetical protein
VRGRRSSTSSRRCSRRSPPEDIRGSGREALAYPVSGTDAESEPRRRGQHSGASALTVIRRPVPRRLASSAPAKS